MTKTTLAVTIALTLAAPALMVGAAADGPSDEATWGLCTAKDASEDGNEASNGTVNATPAFSNVSEEDCEDAEDPWNGTPADDHVPEDPGAPEDPGEEPPEDPGGENPPDDQGPP